MATPQDLTQHTPHEQPKPAPLPGSTPIPGNFPIPPAPKAPDAAGLTPGHAGVGDPAVGVPSQVPPDDAPEPNDTSKDAPNKGTPEDKPKKKTRSPKISRKRKIRKLSNIPLLTRNHQCPEHQGKLL